MVEYTHAKITHLSLDLVEVVTMDEYLVMTDDYLRETLVVMLSETEAETLLAQLMMIDNDKKVMD